jgi:hypothetical protein
MKRIFALLGIVVAVATSPAAAAPATGTDNRASARDDAAWCGTDGTRLAQSLARHRANERRLERGFAAARATGEFVPFADPEVRDEGGVVVIKDNGTLVLDQNPFDFAALGVKIKFVKKTGLYKLVKLKPAIGETLGDKLPLGDDDSMELELPSPVLFFGKKHNSVWINSDGNLTFEDPDDASTERDLGRARNGPPRIAAFFQDFDPTAATGTAGVYARFTGKRLIVTWLNVPQFGVNDQNTFQVEIASNGLVKFRFGANLEEKNGLVGVFPGSGSPLNLIDWSEDIGSSYTGAIAENFADTVTVDEAGLANIFFDHYSDVYSHLIMFEDFPYSLGGLTIAYEYSPKNQIRGIGQELYDSSSTYGSGGTLEAMVQMGDVSKYGDDIREPAFINNVLSPLGILMHELAHRWLLFVHLAKDGLQPDALLGRGGAHWSFYSQSHASFLEGSELEDQGGGRFMTLRVPTSYNMQDLYLMGFATPDEVDDADQPFYIEGVDSDADTRAPQPDVLILGARRDYSIENIIAAEGPRVPAAAAAPKSFQMAVVLLTRNGEEPSVAALARAQRFSKQLPKEFKRQTLGRGKLSTKIEPK